MNKFFLLALLLSSAVRADSTALTADFLSMLPKYGITPSKEQAYCYYKDGAVAGYQVKKPQRIASLTKLLTTYFASELLDLHQRFTTRIHINGTHLHIEGGRDPYFEEEKILLLMKSLNNLGYRSFSKVTFDSNFIFTDSAFSSHADITPAHTKTRLTVLMSPAGKPVIKGLWQTTANFAQEEGISIDASRPPALLATTVAFSEINPLIDRGSDIYLHQSLPFHRILKSMNVMSKNHVAQNVFREASRLKSFDIFMQGKGFESSTFKIYNGSGLPVEGRSRLDNEASCELILRLSLLLEKSISKHKLILSDVLAVNGGKDLGSFRSRFLQYPETHQAVLAKTGTLKHTSSLAGMLMMEEGVPFAILNHTTVSTSGRAFQDEFVSRLFHHLGTPRPLDYQKISIFPWDGSDFLKTTFNQNLASNDVE